MKRREFWIALLGVPLAVAALGLVIGLLPSEYATVKNQPKPIPPEAAAPADPKFDAVFQDAVEHLRRGRLHEAMIALEAARLMRPEQPEVHTNLGFAYLALGQHGNARSSFDQAIELRAQQLNAYYGLANALAGLGDTAGAVSAMRSFLHLSAPDHPFHQRALAAVFEWELRLRIEEG